MAVIARQETVIRTETEAPANGKQVLKLTAEVQGAVQVRGTDQSTVEKVVMIAATTGTVGYFIVSRISKNRHSSG